MTFEIDKKIFDAKR